MRRFYGYVCHLWMCIVIIEDVGACSIRYKNNTVMKIVAAFDSFKGSLTASEACASARDGLLSVVPDAEVISLPVGDGGEGTADALVRSLGGNYAECEVSGPLGDTVTARYGFLADGTAVMDMAAASGLTLVPPEKRNPLEASSFGTGEMMLDALGRRRRLCIRTSERCGRRDDTPSRRGSPAFRRHS